MKRMLLTAALLVLAVPVSALEWKSTLQEGIEEAGKSGRAIFLVTMWKQSV